jgi:hypothetical protein
MNFPILKWLKLSLEFRVIKLWYPIYNYWNTELRYLKTKMKIHHIIILRVCVVYVF